MLTTEILCYPPVKVIFYLGFNKSNKSRKVMVYSSMAKNGGGFS
jgi:hypothetical protein